MTPIEVDLGTFPKSDPSNRTDKDNLEELVNKNIASSKQIVLENLPYHSFWSCAPLATIVLAIVKQRVQYYSSALEIYDSAYDAIGLAALSLEIKDVKIQHDFKEGHPFMKGVGNHRRVEYRKINNTYLDSEPIMDPASFFNLATLPDIVDYIIKERIKRFGSVEEAAKSLFIINNMAKRYSEGKIPEKEVSSHYTPSDGFFVEKGYNTVPHKGTYRNLKDALIGLGFSREDLDSLYGMDKSQLAEEVKRKWKEMSRKLHPDLTHGEGVAFSNLTQTHKRVLHLLKYHVRRTYVDAFYFTRLAS